MNSPVIKFKNDVAIVYIARTNIIRAASIHPHSKERSNEID